MLALTAGRPNFSSRKPVSSEGFRFSSCAAGMHRSMCRLSPSVVYSTLGRYSFSSMILLPFLPCFSTGALSSALYAMTAKTRLRLLPPLTLSEHDVDMALEILGDVLSKMEPTAPKEQA